MKSRKEEIEAEIKRLQRELSRIEADQLRCNHDWCEPFEERMTEPIYETRWQGVDCYPEIVGYKQVPCWSRVCKKCGKKETTQEFGEIVVQTKTGPKF